jgi:hypothetical protein
MHRTGAQKDRIKFNGRSTGMIIGLGITIKLPLDAINIAARRVSLKGRDLFIIEILGLI